MRVPLDFRHPFNLVWPGYDCPPGQRTDPPVGIGYQLWETTTEGSPITPVFGTIRELAAYAAEHCTTFADMTATPFQWEQMLSGHHITVRIGNTLFT